jgi:hypothetical protein
MKMSTPQPNHCLWKGGLVEVILKASLREKLCARHASQGKNAKDESRWFISRSLDECKDTPVKASSPTLDKHSTTIYLGQTWPHASGSALVPSS